MRSIYIIFVVVLILGSLSLANPTQNNGPYCNTCQAVVDSTESWLASGSSTQQVLQMLEQVCQFLPASEQKQCVNVINNYAEEVIQLLIKNFPPEQVCYELALCDNNSTDVTIAVHKYKAVKPSRQAKKGSDDTYCQICTTLVQWYDNWADSNATVTAVEKELGKVCGILPESAQQACVSFIAKYTPMVIQYAVGQSSPQYVCSMLDVCGTDTDVYNKRHY